MIGMSAAERIEQFLAKLHEDVYPEQESSIHEKLTKRAFELITQRVTEKASVLDVGIGCGYASNLFKANGWDVTGTTLCKSELAPNVVFADQNDLPFIWSGKFDVVFARHVLEHSPIPLFTLSEFRRVLKPQGWLYVEVPAPETACHHEANPNHYSILGHLAWVSLIARAGFEIVDALRHDFEVQAGPDIYFAFLCRAK